jgi:hypothetical protein
LKSAGRTEVKSNNSLVRQLQAPPCEGLFSCLHPLFSRGKAWGEAWAKGVEKGKKWEKVVEKGEKWSKVGNIESNPGEGGAENVSRHPRATS